MANIKISSLSNAGALNGTEVLPIVQGNATVKTTTQNIANLLGINYTPENVANKDTDTTLSANSDTKYPSQKAVKSYVDSTVVSAIKDNGNWDASSGLFPTVNSQGQPITKGDLWYISVGGTLGGTSVLAGYSIRALKNAPGQSVANWGILNVGLGYVPENVANKSTDVTLSANSDTLYPSQKAVKSYIDNKPAAVANLQQVTSAGATTTSNITANQFSTAVGSSLQSTGGLVAKNIVLQPTIGSSTNQVTFDSSLITGNKTYTLPNASGTLVLTSSLSNYLPLSGGNMTGGITSSATISTSASISAGTGIQSTSGDITAVSGSLYAGNSYGIGWLGSVAFIESSGSISLGSTDTHPDTSAILDLQSTNKGFLPPRMTYAQRTAMPSFATGLMVYQIDGEEGVWVKRSDGWFRLAWYTP